VLEPLTVLSYIAATTSTLRLGTGICLVGQRNPVYTAKQVADVDALSGGRVDFGIGVGWLREEFDVLQVPFEHRGARADEHIAVMKTLWTEEISEFHGRFYDMPPCQLYPKPVQQPHPPIHVGGESDAAIRRTARLGQGWFGFNRLPEQVPEALERLDKALAAQGRTRAEIQVSVCPYFNPIDADTIKRYADLGVDRVITVLLGFDRDGFLRAADEQVALVEAAK
jgi:probable F420-dependent oxidoreductase